MAAQGQQVANRFIQAAGVGVGQRERALEVVQRLRVGEQLARVLAGQPEVLRGLRRLPAQLKMLRDQAGDSAHVTPARGTRQRLGHAPV